MGVRGMKFRKLPSALEPPVGEPEIKMSLEDQIRLFDLPPSDEKINRLKRLRYPIWTENKAKLIERYLYYFVLVTKHGVYIDGFAGPQEPSQPEMWAAKLVLESEPRWLRKFFFYDSDLRQAELLRELSSAQPPQKENEPSRHVEVEHADFNSAIHDLLGSGSIGEREASFCLLDQRTFECQWSTVLALAGHRRAEYKIELFYFFPEGWFDRALAAQRDEEVLERWWGGEDWPQLREVKRDDRARLVAQRFRDELGYSSADPWPIFDRKGDGRIMYYMIHATDHAAAPHLMNRAYHQAVTQKEEPVQFLLEFDEWESGRSS